MCRTPYFLNWTTIHHAFVVINVVNDKQHMLTVSPRMDVAFSLEVRSTWTSPVLASANSPSSPGTLDLSPTNTSAAPTSNYPHKSMGQLRCETVIPHRDNISFILSNLSQLVESMEGLFAVICLLLPNASMATITYKNLESVNMLRGTKKTEHWKRTIHGETLPEAGNQQARSSAFHKAHHRNSEDAPVEFAERSDFAAAPPCQSIYRKPSNAYGKMGSLRTTEVQKWSWRAPRSKHAYLYGKGPLTSPKLRMNSLNLRCAVWRVAASDALTSVSSNCWSL